MEITTEDRPDGVFLMRLAGRLDIAGAGAVDLPFAAHLSNRKGPVVVDISGVSYLASLGVRTLLVNARTLAGRGSQLRLAAPNDDVRAVLEALSLEAVLPIYDSVEDACAAAASGAEESLWR